MPIMQKRGGEHPEGRPAPDTALVSMLEGCSTERAHQAACYVVLPGPERITALGLVVKRDAWKHRSDGRREKRQDDTGRGMREDGGTGAAEAADLEAGMWGRRGIGGRGSRPSLWWGRLAPGFLVLHTHRRPSDPRAPNRGIECLPSLLLKDEGFRSAAAEPLMRRVSLRVPASH